jgi:hypothetical protein
MNNRNAARRTVEQRLRDVFRRRPRRHDPLLVLSMSIFNFEDGWSRILNPIRLRENGSG